MSDQKKKLLFGRPSMEEMRRKTTQNEIWKSIFRHNWQDNQRNRALQVLDNVFLHLHPVRVARHATNLAYTWGMGGITFLLFIVLTITGVILMFYYHPSAEYAYNDMKYLMHDVAFGPFIRNMHRWAAHAMVITVMLHMFRVFLTGSYKPPRQFNWGIGVILLVLTFLLSFTGYLLPWDQLAIWAVTVGTNMARATPFLGNEGPFGPQLGMKPNNDIRFILLGGTQVGPPTLLRFYVGHCIFLPIIASVLMIVHFWRVRKDGGISGPTVESPAAKAGMTVAERFAPKRPTLVADPNVTTGEPLNIPE
ncbi:MAG TPA: cytochrome b N-terminal domain-containing protein [Candidatus Kapabacteria bacterium]|nr:cytochrome b N-terminal domain-containing protein [Candidatus Kapabacteria bacterium]